MPQNWIHKLNESNSRLHKEEVISQALSAVTLGDQSAQKFLVLAQFCYNPFMPYNIKKIPVTDSITGEDNNIEEFVSLLENLASRVVTGNSAIAAVEQASLNYDSDLWNNLLRPVILKDLRVGATVKTFNKILKKTEFEINVFECQLATDSEKHPNKLVGKKILEPKLDGIRILAVIDNRFPEQVQCNLFSRNGKPMPNFPAIEEQLKKQFAYTPTWSTNRVSRFVLDGEIISENFQALMKQAQRKTDINTADAVYTIFDVIPRSHFDSGKWVVPQCARTSLWLGEIKDRINSSADNLHVISGIEVDLDTAEGHDIMRRYGEDHVAMGYEGIMIKNVDAPYECKRRTNWMKWKPTISVDLTVVGVEEGTGRNEGRLGALVCEGVDDGVLIKVNVGGGFCDAQRDIFWEDREHIIGDIVEIKADVVTQNQDGGYSLRFPRFLRFRGTEPGEKI